MILIGTTLLGCLFLGDIYNATSVIWNGKFSCVIKKNVLEFHQMHVMSFYTIKTGVPFGYVNN